MPILPGSESLVHTPPWPNSCSVHRRPQLVMRLTRIGAPGSGRGDRRPCPSSKHNRDDPLHRYAYIREADHWWSIGEVDQTVKCLAHRESNDPRENLERWREWLFTFQTRFSQADPIVLHSRARYRHWTGRAGNALKQLRLFSALLPDHERVLGRDHPATLTTRFNIAYFTGEAGDARGRFRLFLALLPDREQVWETATRKR